MTKENFYPIVELFWKDHYSIGDLWYDVAEIQGVRILSAVGYLVNEDDDYYYLGSNFDFTTEKFCGGTAVLKNCIVKRRILSKGIFNYDKFSTKRRFLSDGKKSEASDI